MKLQEYMIILVLTMGGLCFFLGSSGLAVALGVTFGVLLFLSVAANIYLIYRQSQTKGEQGFYLNHFQLLSTIKFITYLCMKD